MLVYRLESKENSLDGAYRTYTKGGTMIGYLLSGHSDSFLNHPTPCEDPLMADAWARLEAEDKEEEYFFAFEHMGGIQEWFFCTYLYQDFEHKLHVAIYDVPDEYTIVGKKQVAFKMDESTCLETMSLTEYLEKV